MGVPGPKPHGFGPLYLWTTLNIDPHCRVPTALTVHVNRRVIESSTAIGVMAFVLIFSPLLVVPAGFGFSRDLRSAEF